MIQNKYLSKTSVREKRTCADFLYFSSTTAKETAQGMHRVRRDTLCSSQLHTQQAFDDQAAQGEQAIFIYLLKMAKSGDILYKASMCNFIPIFSF